MASVLYQHGTLGTLMAGLLKELHQTMNYCSMVI